MDNFAPPKLFADLTELASGLCHDYISGASAVVDVVDILVAGTSCKDASRLNPHHATRLNVIDAGLHTTGGTFAGFARLVARFGAQCRLVFLENVTSLRDKDVATGRSNFDGVADTVRALGFGFVHADFSAVDMGLPVARPRLYMAGVRARDVVAAQQRAQAVLQAISSNARSVPLDALLMQNADSSLTMGDWCREGLARQRTAPVLQGEEVWHQHHRNAWHEIPPSLAGHYASRMEANPWFCALPRRSRDLLLLALCRNHLARHRPLAIPLNVSLGWEKFGPTDHLPTLTPSGIFWLVRQERLLLGVEAIRLQGCDPSMLPGLRPGSHDSQFLQNLAGNAFCVYQFCAWMLAALAAGDLAGAARE